MSFKVTIDSGEKKNLKKNTIWAKVDEIIWNFEKVLCHRLTKYLGLGLYFH